MRALACVILTAGLVACGPEVGVEDGGAGSSESGVAESTGSSATSAGSSAGTSVGSSTTGETTSASTSGTESSTGRDDVAFIDPSETTGCFTLSCASCDPWAQDCPPGEKCNPWANDGGSAWNDYRCVPVAPDPKQPGEPCTVEGSGVSGIDDCDVASMCFWVDPETNTGTCVAFCQGQANDPSCAEPCHECALSGDGVLILCLPKCDPLASECPVGQGCYPVNDGFACYADGSGRGGALGEPCEYVNGCDPGLFCATAEVVPGCAGALGCCASFCNLGAADPCPGADPAVECMPWWEPGQEPMDECIAGGLGACVLPW